MNIEQSSYSSFSDSALLEKLIGVRQTQQFYRGSLAPLFASDSEQDALPEQCLVARELVKRWLGEELMHGDMLNAPGTVRDFLRLFFAGRGYEVLWQFFSMRNIRFW